MARRSREPRVLVAGSSNMDLIAYLDRDLPRAGETIAGKSFKTGFGGKGANQAVMAAKLGAATVFVGKVGTDSFGKDMQENFRRVGIDTTFLLTTCKASSGVAPITVTGNGQNAIVVVGGANMLVTASEVADAFAALEKAKRIPDVVMVQLEIAMEASLAALQHGRRVGARTVFNPAPARADIPAEMLRAADVIVPNETEAELLTGLPVTTVAEAEAAAHALVRKGAGSVVVTLGANGCVVLENGATTPVHVKAPTAEAVRDTTGAGDSWLGMCAYQLGLGASLVQAAERACIVATQSVQRLGTQSSYPDRHELDPGLFRL